MEERRRAPRLKVKLSIALRLPDGETAALGETLDLSRNGAYFTSEYFMAEGTRLPVTLELPADEAYPSAAIHPDGIVVRCQPEAEDPAVRSYEVAVFFMDLAKDEQLLLDGFLERRLGRATAR